MNSMGHSSPNSMGNFPGVQVDLKLQPWGEHQEDLTILPTNTSRKSVSQVTTEMLGDGNDRKALVLIRTSAVQTTSPENERTS